MNNFGGRKVIEIKKKINGNELNISIAGRLDTMTAPQLEAELKGVLEPNSLVVFDFEELQYLSSAGLRVLAAVQKLVNKDGSLKLIKVNEVIYEILEDVGFTDFMDIEAL